MADRDSHAPKSRAFVLRSCVACVAVLVSVRIGAHPSAPPPGVTGGFGEDTCTKCHNTYALNAGRSSGLGALVVSGLPKEYQPGATYPVRVELTHIQDHGVWGFELAARAKTGAQAGVLKPVDSHAQIVSEKGIQYVAHTAEGTFFNAFEFTWVAPTTSAGEVVVNVAGNAADGDASPVGDYIYSASVTIPPASR